MIGHPLRRNLGLCRIEQRFGEAHVDLFRLRGEFEAVGLERGKVELGQVGLVRLAARATSPSGADSG